MFDLIQKNKRLMQIVLALVLLPFAFFGVDSYFRAGESDQVVATVGGHRITRAEFEQALRERQEMMQSLSGNRVDPALLDNAELRFAVLDSLVRQRLLLDRALRAGMTVTDAQLQSVIAEVPGFQQEGRFSYARYEQFLKAQGMTPPMFENRVRQDMLMQHVSDAYAGSHFMPRTVAELLVRLSEQQREVSQSVIPADRFVAQVKLEPDAAKRYYDGNQDEFRVPEQVRIEYVLLSVESLLPQIQVSPAEVRKYYDEHLGQFESKESRRASHILIAVEPGADAAARQKARARAEQLYAQLQQDPGRFAELAKQHSQDPGSAAKGGDLGFFSRGALVKPFEDAVFAMKPGELSPPVETQYGYHLIRLTAVQPAKGRGFEEVRPQIEAELKKQLAGRKFAETAEAFNNAAFEQSDSLKPAAEIAKSPLRQSGWLSRSGGAEDARLNNPRLLQAVFSEDVLRNKRNTEAVEIAPGVLAAARILEHKPASVQPFEQVRAAIEKKLVLARAGQLAAQEGRQRLEALRQGKEAQVAWGAPQLVSRADAKGLAEPVARQVFRADVASLPAYAGVELPQGGYVLLRISRVIEPDKVTPEKRKAVAESLQQVLGQEQFAAYVASLRQKGGVKISKELIEKK